MTKLKILHFPARVRSAPFVALLLLFPALLCGQSAARDALHSFPADTQQMVNSNLAQLRVLSNYQQIRQWIFTQQLRDFEGFLRSIGTDAEIDVDEVTLGWRSDPTNSAFFGLAEGRLDPERTHDYFVKRQMLYQQYAGYELYPVGMAGGHADIFFVYFDSSSAAFGRLAEIKTILDVRAGTRAALDSNSDFARGAAELDGTAPQWGIARGAAAASQALPWLTAGTQQTVDAKAFFAPIQLVLYRFDWGNGLSMHMSVVCRNAQDATSLAQVLAFLRNVRPAAGTSSSVTMASLFQGINLQTNNSRLEISSSIPTEIAERIFRNDGATTPSVIP